jgi:hypothetical protein
VLRKTTIGAVPGRRDNWRLDLGIWIEKESLFSVDGWFVL